MENKNIPNTALSKDAAINPIVFMNTPISEDEEDLLGIRPTVDAIKSAIQSGAKMIGVIADYGTGKSSLTDMLCKDSSSNAIKINMWDSLSKQKSQSEDDVEVISELTKSFLFQLALGHSTNAAKYVNRKLSKGYSILSFSLSSENMWPLIGIGALLVLLLSLIFSSSLDVTAHAIHDLFPEISAVAQLSITFAAKHLMAMILFAVLAIIVFKAKDASIAFSNWKTNSQRTVEINDVFETYLYIYDILLSENENRIVIVEDLDRVDDKKLVLKFLKEIYRFAYLPQERESKSKKSPVFIVSVKSEESLINNNPESKLTLDNDLVYPKLFDYSVILRPIHFEDYGDIVLHIIGDKKETLNNLLEPKDRIQGFLPKSFYWLIQGNNLTIRQLKDRLNAAVSLLVSLKNKNYTSQPCIKFSSCAAVVYLESQYPKEYSSLIHQEKILSELVQNSFKICSSVGDMQHKEAELISMIQNEISNSQALRTDIAKMLAQRDIDDDFRMYFYSYPKESYIKNADERDVLNLLLYPNEYSSDEKLNEKMERINGAGKTNTIQDALKRLCDEEKSFPSIILQNESLFRLSYEFNAVKTEECIKEKTVWEEENYEQNISLLETINSYDLSQKEKEKVWADYEQWLLSNCRNPSINAQLIQIRKQMIKAFKADIILFKNLFISSEKWSVPIITKDELEMISSFKTGLKLIDPEHIDSRNISYLSEYINASVLEGEHLTRATNIYRCAMKGLNANVLWCPIIDFLTANAMTDSDMFQYVLSAMTMLTEDEKELGKEKIGQYLQVLTDTAVPEDYTFEIDNAIIDKSLPRWMLNSLYSHRIFAALLSFLVKENRIADGIIDFTNQDNINPIKSACSRIDNHLIPTIRQEIIRQYNSVNKQEQLLVNYSDLYFGENPVITYKECACLDSLELVLKLVNRTAIMVDQHGSQKDVVDYINEKSTKTTCLQCLERLFSAEHEDRYTTAAVARAVIQKLDFENMGFYLLSDDEKDQAITFIEQYINLRTTAEAADFMQNTTKCLIPCLERTVAQNGVIYIKLIEDINVPTAYTVEWLRENEVHYKLPTKTLEKIRQDGQEKNYLIGKVLSENKFEYPFKYVADETIIGEYTPESPIWDIMKDNPNLVSHILNKELYRSLNTSVYTEVLRPLYKGKQTSDFVEFLFSVVSNAEKESYLSNMNEIASADDSIKISKFLTQPENIVFLRDDVVFEHVRNRLWEDENKVGRFKGYKSCFTRKRNETVQLNLVGQL